MENQSPQYPIFRYVSGKVIPGVGARDMLVLVVLVLIGVVLFVSSGRITTTHESTLDTTERSAVYTQYVRCRDAAWTVANPDSIKSGDWDEATGACRLYADEATLEDLLAQAEEEGITATTTNTELMGKVPDTKTETEPLMGGFSRAVIFLLLPPALLVGFCLEISQGSSLRHDLARLIKWKQTQKVYFYRSRWEMDRDHEGGVL